MLSGRNVSPGSLRTLCGKYCKMRCWITGGLFLVAVTVFGQVTELVTYKSLDTLDLQLEVIQPAGMEADSLYPAVVFFFGGGWVGGSRDQFRPQAAYISRRGVVCFLADYRTRKSAGVTPFECVMDAKSAMRYVRANARFWSVDPDRIAAAGGAAGGHLAAATALVAGYEHPDEGWLKEKPYLAIER